jgi:hypothetical protein
LYYDDHVQIATITGRLKTANIFKPKKKKIPLSVPPITIVLCLLTRASQAKNAGIFMCIHLP